MYQPKHQRFLETRSAVLQALIAEYPLATLVVNGPDGLQSNVIPLLFDATRGEHGTLIGHVARQDPLARMAGEPVLALFRGPDAYVTPAWYPEKAVHGKVVPTWNYAVVEARGALQVLEAPEQVLGIVTRMTQHFEAGRAQPWAVDDAPAEFIDSMLRAIAGIEIPLEQLQGKFKLSQNRSAETMAGVQVGLENSSGAAEQAVARWMAAS